MIYYQFAYWDYEHRTITLVVKRPCTISEMLEVARKLEHDAA